MAQQKYQYKTLSIADLLLNSANPRFDPVKHQTEAIEAMIEDQTEKLVGLARHISDFGLNPTDIVLVTPLNKQWLVKEGNRRVTVLKLLNEPALIPEGYEKIRREFNKLNTAIDQDLLKNIPCVIIEDEVISNEWIRLKHTGQNEGAGTVSWNSQQTNRFKAQIEGKADARILFFDELRNNPEIPKKYKDKFSNIKKTNFDRLMGDPDVREFLGITYENAVFSLPLGINEYLIEILEDLIFRDMSVGNIYRKDDREAYIDQIKQRVIQKQQQKVTNEADQTKDNSQYDITSGDIGNNTGNSSVKKRTYPINRKTLVPAQHKLTITHPRLVKIFNELKAIDIDTYTNAVAVLFRVFIELSSDCYISKNNIAGVNQESKLTVKISAVTDYMKSQSIMNDFQLHSARQMASSITQNSSVKTFHSYVHNIDVTPISKDVKTAWDDLWPFIENLWR